MIIEKYDWQFDIDIQRTKLIYANRLNNIISRDKHCVLCGATDHLVVHHNNYSNLGHENDEDLVTLCQEHHNFYHKYERSQGRR